MNNPRTLSGIDSDSIRHLSLPSSTAALLIGGDSGTNGQVLTKNEDTNKLEWDDLEKRNIAPNSIDGSRLTNDISFTTTGNITLNDLTATSKIISQGDVNTPNTRKIELDTATGNIRQFQSYTDDTTNNEYFSVKNGIVAMRGATLGGTLSGENELKLVESGNFIIENTAGGITTEYFKIEGTTGNILKVNNITTTGNIQFNTDDGELLGDTSSNTICKNLNLSDVSNIFRTDIEHGDIKFYVELEGTNGIDGSRTFFVDATNGNTTINGNIQFGSTAGQLLGDTTSNTICKNLDLSDPSNIIGTDIEHGDIKFYVELEGTNGIGGSRTFFVDATNGNITDCGSITSTGNITTTTDIKGRDLIGIRNIITTNGDGGINTFSIDATTGNITGNVGDTGATTYTITTEDGTTDKSHATFDRLTINGNDNVDSGSFDKPNLIVGETILRQATSTQAIRIQSSSTPRNDFIFRPNTAQAGTNAAGHSIFRGSILMPDTTRFNDNDDIGGALIFGLDDATTTIANAPMYIGNLTSTQNDGGIVFQNQRPCIVGNTGTGTKTKCFNLDLTSSSNDIPTAINEPHEAMCELMPSSIVSFPVPVVGETWNETNFMFMRGVGGIYEQDGLVSPNWFVDVNRNDLPSDRKMVLSFNVWLRQTLIKARTSTAQQTGAIMYRWNYRIKGSGSAAETIIGEDYYYLLHGDATHSIAYFEFGQFKKVNTILQFPEGTDNYEVFPRFSNRPEQGDPTIQDRAYMDMAFGGHNPAAFMYSKPPPDNFRQVSS